MTPGGARPGSGGRHASSGDRLGGRLLIAGVVVLPLLIAVLWIASALGHPLAVR